jgi:hypothetical protein
VRVILFNVKENSTDSEKEVLEAWSLCDTITVVLVSSSFTMYSYALQDMPCVWRPQHRQILEEILARKRWRTIVCVHMENGPQKTFVLRPTFETRNSGIRSRNNNQWPAALGHNMLRVFFLLHLLLDYKFGPHSKYCEVVGTSGSQRSRRKS